MQVATLQLQLPQCWAASRPQDAPDYVILAKLHFGRSEVTVTAQDMETQQQLSASIVFAHT